MGKIIIGYGASQYDVLLYFTKEMAKGFEKRAKEVILVDLNNDYQVDLIRKIPVSNIEFVFSFNIPIFSIIQEWVGTNIVEVTFYVDHPMYHHERQTGSLCRNAIHVFVDEFWREYADKYYRNCGKNIMLPHGASVVPNNIDYFKRKYDVVLLGGYKDPKVILSQIIAKRGTIYKNISVDIINSFLCTETCSLEKIVGQVFEKYDWQLDTKDISEFMAEFQLEDEFIRMYCRDAVIRELLKNKISISVFRKGWENFECQNTEYLDINSAVNYDTALNIMANTKILVNITPTLNAGAHERIFSSMANGAICFTNKSLYLMDNNLDQECVMYSLCELNTLSDMIKLILANPDKATVISEHAKKVVQNNYTWENLAQQILDVVEEYRKENLKKLKANNQFDEHFVALDNYITGNDVETIYTYMKRCIMSHENDRTGYFKAMMSSFNRYKYWGTLEPSQDDYNLLELRAKEIKEHWNDFRWIYNSLQDWQSKDILMKILENWLTYSPYYLNSIHDNTYEEYFDLDIISCSEDEVFVDLGSYIGDTILSYISNMHHYAQIYTYEASVDNMYQVKENTKSYSNITYRQCAVGNYNGLAYLDINDDKSANCISTNGGNAVNIVTLDSDIKEKITFLKMDIEGSETNAIEGAKRHIREEHPKLAIACYHNNHDIWRLAKQIYEIEPGYRFYLRYYGGALYPSEYVLYGICEIE